MGAVTTTLNGAALPIVLPDTSTWTMQAADEREKAIITLQEVRASLRDIRVLLNGYDLSLSAGVSPFQRQVDERLAWLLLAREDARG